MREETSGRGDGTTAAIEGLQLVVEASSWIVAWLVLPTWLALSGAGAADFLFYGIGAGLFLALGVAADRSDDFASPEFAWVALTSVLGVLLVGGLVFASASFLS